MYRLFYNGEYQGEFKYYPWVYKKLCPAYILNMQDSLWLMQENYQTNFIELGDVPKKYLVLNLLL